MSGQDEEIESGKFLADDSVIYRTLDIDFAKLNSNFTKLVYKKCSVAQMNVLTTGTTKLQMLI